MCIASNKTFNDPRRLRHETDGLFIASPDDMVSALPQYREAIDNTMRIAEMCNVELKLGQNVLPRFQLPEGATEAQFLEKLAREGLDRRFARSRGATPTTATATAAPGGGGRDHRQDGLLRLLPHRPGLHQLGEGAQHPGRPGARLGRRLDSRLGAAHHRPGPDPLEPAVRALPEPERVSMPDFDVDFCQDRRDEVIRYVAGKYGQSNVGQIITFGSLKARSVIRDVVRVMGLPSPRGTASPSSSPSRSRARSGRSRSASRSSRA